MAGCFWVIPEKFARNGCCDVNPTSPFGTNLGRLATHPMRHPTYQSVCIAHECVRWIGSMLHTVVNNCACLSRAQVVLSWICSQYFFALKKLCFALLQVLLLLVALRQQLQIVGFVELSELNDRLSRDFKALRQATCHIGFISYSYHSVSKRISKGISANCMHGNIRFCCSSITHELGRQRIGGSTHYLDSVLHEVLSIVAQELA